MTVVSLPSGDSRRQSAAGRNDTNRVAVYRPFIRELNRMSRGDAAEAAVALEVSSWLNRWRSGDTAMPEEVANSLPENVGSFAVGPQHVIAVWEADAIRVPLFLGTLEDLERWAAHHHGHRLRIDRSSGQATYVGVPGGDYRPRYRISDKVSSRSAPFAAIPAILLHGLGLEDVVVYALRTLICEPTLDGDSVALLCALRLPNDAVFVVLVQALELLTAHRQDEAVKLLEQPLHPELKASRVSDRLAHLPRRLRDLRWPETSQSVFAGCGDQYFEELGVSAAARLVLGSRLTRRNLETAASDLLLDALELPDHVLLALRAAVRELNSRHPDRALAIISCAAGHMAEPEEHPEALKAALEAGSEWFAPVRAFTDDEIDRLVLKQRFADWMLFLHPDQYQIVESDFNGPARLIGVAGSGKTCILVHRANRMAALYPKETIRIFTLSRSLVSLLETLLDRLCRQEVRERIVVQAMYDYCYELVRTCHPDKGIVRDIEQEGIQLAADIDGQWTDFIRKEHVGDLMEPLVEPLANWRTQKRKEHIVAEDYLRDEMRWIRSGYGKARRSEYFEAARVGRAIPFPIGAKKRKTTEASSERLPDDTRERVLELLKEWEEFMDFGAQYDDEAIALLAYGLRQRIRQNQELSARCVLIDEAQDLSTLELAIAAAVPTTKANGLFLCGDPVQRILPKQQSLPSAGISVTGRAIRLQVNYRNTRSILTAAFALINAYGESAALGPGEILEPRYALRGGSKPLLIECGDVEEEVELAIQDVEGLDEEQLPSTCIATESPRTRNLLLERLESMRIPYVRLDQPVDLNEPGLRVSDLDHMKGHEFDRVILLDLSDSILPVRGRPSGEFWRDAFRIYVAMTRARQDLSMVYVRNPSILLRGLASTVEECEATAWISA